MSLVSMILLLASPAWMGANSYHPNDPDSIPYLDQLDCHWGRIFPDTDKVVVFKDWTQCDGFFAANKGKQVILCLEALPLNEQFARQVLDRYGNQITIVEAINEPPDYASLTNAIRAWQRVFFGRTNRPPLAAPSNQNTIETYGICKRLASDGLLRSVIYICGHEYSGRRCNGNWPCTIEIDHGYTPPDNSTDYGLNALQRYQQIQSLGKKLIITEFTWEPDNQRDAAQWASTFQAAHLKAVLLHWPQQQEFTSLGGMFDWMNHKWNAAMTAFTNTANIVGGLR